jgi:hypothetical protein
LPTDISQNFQQLVYDGRFSTGTLIAVGIGLGLLFALLAWWEGRSTNRWLMPVIFVLRVVALVTILWMLAEPTLQTTISHRSPKSVGIIVDTSASMGTVDRAGEDINTIRWAVACNPTKSTNLIMEIDSAIVALASAQHYFELFADVCRGKGPIQHAKELATQTAKLVQKSSDYFTKTIKRLTDEIGINLDKTDLPQIQSTLADEVLPKISKLHKDVQSGRLLLAPDRTELLDKISDSLNLYKTKLSYIADTLTEYYADFPDEKVSRTLQQQYSMSRLEKVTRLLNTTQNKLNKHNPHKPRVISYRFDNRVRPLLQIDWSATLPIANEDDSMFTDISAALNQAAQDSVSQLVEAFFLLTDGGHNTGGDPLKVASALTESKVYIVPIGNTKLLRDVMLHHVQGPRSVFKNDLIIIEALIDAHGCQNEEIVVELMQNDSILDSREITVTADTYVQHISFEQKAETLGVQEFHLRVKELPDEHLHDNNQAQLSVEVAEDKIRVLLADHLPRWEFRYLRNLFKRDDHIEFEEVLFEPMSADFRYRTKRPEFPDNLDKWTQYRIVILGDIGTSQLTVAQQDLLERYVSERGGTLILIAGQEAMPSAYINQPLGRLLPVEVSDYKASAETGFKLYMTGEGTNTPVTRLTDDPLTNDRLWRSLLPIYNLSDYAKPKPTSHILIAAAPADWDERQDNSTAFLCWQKYGRGRVVYFSAPVTYRFRFRHGDRHHHTFWGQLLRWVVAREISGGSKTVRLLTDKMQYQNKEEVRITVRLNQLEGQEVSGADCRIVARQDDKLIARTDLLEDEDIPGVYMGTLKDLPVGTITIEVAGVEVQELLAGEQYNEPVETTIVMEPDMSLEMRNTRCNLPLLTQIAESSGGMVIQPTSLAEAMSQLDLSPVVTETVNQRPLWNKPLFLLIFLACLSLEWIVRKLTGMA